MQGWEESGWTHGCSQLGTPGYIRALGAMSARVWGRCSLHIPNSISLGTRSKRTREPDARGEQGLIVLDKPSHRKVVCLIPGLGVGIRYPGVLGASSRKKDVDLSGES